LNQEENILICVSKRGWGMKKFNPLRPLPNASFYYF